MARTPNINDPLLQQLPSRTGLITAEQAERGASTSTSAPASRSARSLIDMEHHHRGRSCWRSSPRQLGTQVINLRGHGHRRRRDPGRPGQRGPHVQRRARRASDANSVTLATFDLLSPEVMDELMFVLTRDVSFVVAARGRHQDLPQPVLRRRERVRQRHALRPGVRAEGRRRPAGRRQAAATDVDELEAGGQLRRRSSAS